MKPTLGSLFAGIGGIDLGFERAGFETVFQVELDPFCRRVLAKNFPKADRSVTDVKCGNSKSLPRVDVLAGGFPCQDISNAGHRVGIGGARSGLWKEFHRIIGELQPKYVIVENVAALLGRGMGVVLGDLAEIGYDAEWGIISAADLGAPHLRKRVWILAYPNCERELQSQRLEQNERGRFSDSGSEVAHPQSVSSYGKGEARASRFGLQIGRCSGKHHPWTVEPNVGRVADGVPRRVDRLRGLGNAVVPQIPEYIAGLILEDMKRPENGQGEK